MVGRSTWAGALRMRLATRRQDTYDADYITRQVRHSTVQRFPGALIRHNDEVSSPRPVRFEPAAYSADGLTPPALSAIMTFGPQGAQWKVLGGIYQSTAPTISPGVANTVTETDIANFTTSAGQFVAGDEIAFDVDWDVVNNSGGSIVYTWRLYVGSTVKTFAPSYGTSAQAAGHSARFRIALATLSDPRLSGTLLAGFAGSGFTGLNAGASGVLDPASATADFSGAVTIKLTGQMGSANSSASFRPVAGALKRVTAA